MTINDWMTTKMNKPEVVLIIVHWVIQNRILSNFKVAIHLFEAASNKVVLNVLKSSLERQQCFSVGVF